jgi:hypothetical protein
MGLLGISYGFSLTLFGALWPEIYGLKHLGSIRAVIVAILVFATAMGPGLTGYLIDRDVSIFAQVAVMGMYCFVMAGLMSVVARRISRRSLPAGGGSATSPR